MDDRQQILNLLDTLRAEIAKEKVQPKPTYNQDDIDRAVNKYFPKFQEILAKLPIEFEYDLKIKGRLHPIIGVTEFEVYFDDVYPKSLKVSGDAPKRLLEEIEGLISQDVDFELLLDSDIKKLNKLYKEINKLDCSKEVFEEIDNRLEN